MIFPGRCWLSPAQPRGVHAPKRPFMERAQPGSSVRRWWKWRGTQAGGTAGCDCPDGRCCFCAWTGWGYAAAPGLASCPGPPLLLNLIVAKCHLRALVQSRPGALDGWGGRRLCSEPVKPRMQAGSFGSRGRNPSGASVVRKNPFRWLPRWIAHPASAWGVCLGSAHGGASVVTRACLSSMWPHTNT